MGNSKKHIEQMNNKLMNDLLAEERKSLEQWSALHPDHAKFLRFLDSIQLSPSIQAQGESMRDSIFVRLNERIEGSVTRAVWLKWISMAASVLLLIGLTGYFSYQRGYQAQNSQWVELSNPLGMKSTVSLSDGTRVVLNAGTVLSYPNAFVGKERKVKLKGEAYFEVVSESKHPFIVETEALDVRVYGTKFNVKAYEEERVIEVTLSEGKVGVKLDALAELLSLDPGQQIAYDKVNKRFAKREVDVDCYTLWREGKYYFNSLRLEAIARQLERTFNVRIHIASDQLKQIVITGDFIHGENLEQIMRVMTADRRMKYRMDGDQVYIYEQ